MVGSRVGESISPTSVVSASACALGYGAGGAAVVVVELIISCRAGRCTAVKRWRRSVTGDGGRQALALVLVRVVGHGVCNCKKLSGWEGTKNEHELCRFFF